MTSCYGFSRWSAAGIYVVSIPKLKYAATKKETKPQFSGDSYTLERRGDCF